ncbi:hypothetical protein CANCADRAFT_132469 [Tortispora caseinolytica NRRL Y-17796]|uniref:NADH dehydrogenase [ubiquinone] 1 alpha subcomplex assembly factor 3 n=1 Tax=Tortispora caseinolytica NRRL Y-17796 TaxID=767744 RepID=A0A1E4TB62_9ASCO|nr:hypothetical protein CANCADRAFT_132469 [Tortispora caseinolytica NRRL Y-17796]
MIRTSIRRGAMRPSIYLRPRYVHSSLVAFKDRSIEQVDIDKLTKQRENGLSDFDVMSDLPRPKVQIAGFSNDTIQLSTGEKITKDMNIACLIFGGEQAFGWKLNNNGESNLKGLETGIIEFPPSSLKIFEMVEPKPEILCIGLGNRSRFIGPKTRDFFSNLGMQTEVSSTLVAIDNYELLGTERPGTVSALLFLPDTLEK